MLRDFAGLLVAQSRVRAERVQQSRALQGLAGPARPLQRWLWVRCAFI